MRVRYEEEVTVRSRSEEARRESPPPAPAALLALQRTAGNIAARQLIEPGRVAGPVIQRDLTGDEKADKKRILTDYVRFTPPSTFLDRYGAPPATKQLYKRALLAKIRGNAYIQESLKAKRNMQEDAEDDAWEDGTFNEQTLSEAIDETYGKEIPGRIGRPFAPFDKHDCVFAAITHVLGFGDDLHVSLDKEQMVADVFNHEYGEVEDSILYRMMEILGWGFLGKFDRWDDMFGDTMTADTYIVSENKDSGGTEGHVIAVEPDGIATHFPAKQKFKVYDRQAVRGYKGVAAPRFAIYVWRVNKGTPKAQELIQALS